MFKPTDAAWERLTDSARLAADRAYCPYSGFRVGAAVLMTDGHYAIGANIENASYGLTICAERVAVFMARMLGIDAKPLGVAIYTPTQAPTAPCGACRQVLYEFGGPELRVIAVCDGPKRIDCLLCQLLPAAFGPSDLDAEGDPVPAAL